MHLANSDGGLLEAVFPGGLLDDPHAGSIIAKPAAARAIDARWQRRIS
jgi:hypothetical protein